MAAESPLDHSELRLIEKTLDDGNTREAAARLGMLGDARVHKDAIDFLTTRLLFQRGRIDSDGAADRVGAILDRVPHFPEAEDWLTELEARTERIALGVGTEAQQAPATAAAPAPAATAAPGGPPPTPVPASRAPSIPRDRQHPFFDELAEDEVTPTEAGTPSREELADYRLDSSDPPPLAPAADAGANDAEAAPELEHDGSRPGSEPPTRPDHSRPKSAVFDPPTRPDMMRADFMEGAGSMRPSYKPFDSLRAKEQLNAEAGRYRGDVKDPGEVLGGSRRGRASHAPRTSSRVPPDPERRIMEAFQMVQSGLFDEARRLLPEEGAQTTQRPELRAMLGRVLIELGDAERASGEAAFALERAPLSPDVQLIYVWSAVRYARQRDDAWSLERAGRILKDLPQGAALDGALVDALAACVEVRVGVPTVALRLAQRALRNNADSVDGLAALAEASALCGEEQRAEAALERLHALSEEAAEQLAPRLGRLGVGARGPASSASVWLPLEHTLSSGAREVALAGLESIAAEALAQKGLDPFGDAERTAQIVIELFTLAPVLRHFGPYDLSLHGIRRLEAGLDLLYGPGSRALDVPGASQALWQLAGLYLGETLRRCCEGRWVPGEAQQDAVVELLGGEVQPFHVIRRRIQHGRRATLSSALAEALALAPPAAHGFRQPEALAPELPWGDGSWPTIDELPRYGRSLGHSVVAAYVAAIGQSRLDRSGQSLASLDRYIELVAPADSPLSADSSWARWLAVFAGAYLGEVLCKEFGGNWSATDRDGPEGLSIHLGMRRELPVSLVFDAVTGRHPIALVDYLGQLRQTLGTP
jgi:tetratricopeptide (TPR) repeat protein